MQSMHIHLTNYQKKVLCEVHDNNKLSQKQLAEWAASEFKLERPLSQSAVSTLLAKRKSYDGCLLLNYSHKILTSFIRNESR